MTARKLLADLRRAGVVLSANGDRLAFDAPAGVVTPQLREWIKARKGELLAVLNGDYPRAALALLLSIPDPERREALAEALDERVGICQHDGGMGRGEGERQAYIELARAVEGNICRYSLKVKQTGPQRELLEGETDFLSG